MKIKKTNSISSEQLSMLIFGPSGIGKTSLAKTTDGKTLVISAEAGLLPLKENDIDYIDLSIYENEEKEIEVPRIKRFDYCCKVLEWASQSEYEWIFLDSFSEVAQCLVEQLEADKYFGDPKNNFIKWGEFGKRIMAMAKNFRDMKKNTVLICQAKEELDQFKRKMFTISMTGSAQEKLPYIFDLVFFYNQTQNSEGNTERCLFTSPCEAWVSKDRSGRLDKTEKPNLALIKQKIFNKEN